MESLILAVTMVCALGASTPVSATAGPKAPETRTEYVRKAHAELDELSVKIDALELKAEEAGSQAREGLDKKLEALRKRRTTAKKDFSKLRSASGKAWSSLKAGVEKDIAELRTAYDEAAKN